MVNNGLQRRRAATPRRGTAQLPLKVAGNRIEDAGQAAADRVERADRGDRDQSGDQTVFDCRRATFVTEQPADILEQAHRFFSQAEWTPKKTPGPVKLGLTGALLF